MRRVQTHRDKHGPHLALKILLHPDPLCGRTLVVRQKPQSLRGQGWEQLVVVDAVLALDRIVQKFGKFLETLLAVRPAMVVGFGGAQVQLGAHLEKLIQVGRDNAQKPQALQERNIFALSPRQNPQVEVQQTLVTVQQRQGLG